MNSGQREEKKEGLGMEKYWVLRVVNSVFKFSFDPPTLKKKAFTEAPEESLAQKVPGLGMKICVRM